MDLVVDRSGNGTRLTLVHGWAMHGGLLRGLARELEGFERVRIDLPGHGRHREIPWPDDDAVIADHLAETGADYK